MISSVLFVSHPLSEAWLCHEPPRKISSVTGSLELYRPMCGSIAQIISAAALKNTLYLKITRQFWQAVVSTSTDYF